eukprot:548791-Prymnesium_polylepis.1
MPPRLAPHERRIPHRLPSTSPAHRADRVDRRGHNEDGSHERGRRRPPPRALAGQYLRIVAQDGEPASVADEQLAEDRQQAEVEAHFAANPQTTAMQR